ncbi:MAG: hypothetical protein ISR65_17130 [Bacteriovoracaceae bacterium]|nr:hypothetical protein [Bacteriovoracaceae bacterium]
MNSKNLQKIKILAVLFVLFSASNALAANKTLIAKCNTVDRNLIRTLGFYGLWRYEQATYIKNDALEFELYRSDKQYSLKLKPTLNGKPNERAVTLTRIMVQLHDNFISIHYAPYSQNTGGGRRSFLLNIKAQQGYLSWRVMPWAQDGSSNGRSAEIIDCEVL